MHNINLALRFSDKIIMLNKGRVVFAGKPKNLTSKIIEVVYGVKVEVILDKNVYR